MAARIARVFTVVAASGAPPCRIARSAVTYAVAEKNVPSIPSPIPISTVCSCSSIAAAATWKGETVAGETLLL